MTNLPDMSTQRHVMIHTDGACSGNPGPGGYGVLLQFDRNEQELSGGYKLTTNNRMELMAAIVGIGALEENCRVTLYSDSRYVVDSISKGWAQRWRDNGWMRNKKDSASNPDLWERLLNLCAKHEAEFRWVPGHAGNPENERCDRLAVRAARQSCLPIDEGYHG